MTKLTAEQIGAMRSVKLHWGSAEKSGMHLQADTPFGRYYIALRPDNHWFWWRPASGSAHHGCARSAAEALDQCQADYTRRILAALGIEEG